MPSVRDSVYCGRFIVAAPAFASSVSYNSSGNCNNWIPHGWSETTWSGYTSNDTGYAQENLSWYTGGSWHIMMWDNDVYKIYGNGDTTAEAYFGDSMQGTGSWQEDGWHWGTILGTKFHDSKSISG